MKIGVSGASGHLGRAVVSELLERADGHEIVAISRTPETINAPATQASPRCACRSAEISFGLKAAQYKPWKVSRIAKLVIGAAIKP